MALAGVTRLSAWLLKVALAALLLYAGWAKLADPAAFAEEIRNYRFFAEAAPLMATVLPGIEVVLGVVLLVAPLGSGWLQAAAITCAGLMLLFTVAVTQVVIRGIDIECGCFGGNAGAVTGWTILRDVALLAAALALAWLGRPQPRLSQ